MLQQANHYDDCKVCFLLPCTCMVAWVALLYKVVANGALKFDKKTVYFWLLFSDQPKDLLSLAFVVCLFLCFILKVYQVPSCTTI